MILKWSFTVIADPRIFFGSNRIDKKAIYEPALSLTFPALSFNQRRLVYILFFQNTIKYFFDVRHLTDKLIIVIECDKCFVSLFFLLQKKRLLKFFSVKRMDGGKLLVLF